MFRWAGTLTAVVFAAGAATAQGEAATGATPEDGWSGRDIYARVLENHLATAKLDQRTISEDRGGDRQESRFWARFRDYRENGGPNADGVISKSLMKYTYPRGRRGSGYLFIEKFHAENEGFSYSRSRGKVMRMSTREETVFGTDFTLEDLVAVRVLEDATYERHPDAVIDGAPVYVVMMNYRPESHPQYARSQLWIDREYFVVLKTLNWDHDGSERNIMEAPRARIERHADVWVPMEIVMRDLRDSTTSWLYTDAVEANPELPDRMFEPTRLPRDRQ